MPLSSIVSLHTLLPELRIIGLTRDHATAAAARAHGITALVVRHLQAPTVTHVIKGIIAR